MGNTVNKAQKFLLDNNCGDLILNDVRSKNAEYRIYASDIMMKFLESERGQNVDTSERQLTIPDVSNCVCFECGEEINQETIFFCAKCDVNNHIKANDC